jgi:SH3 domain-containing protein
MTQHFRGTTVLITGLLLLAADQSDARKREQHYGEGFSVDLTQPYKEVLDVVQQVTNDGVIRGTYEYKGTKDLDGAESANSSKDFSPWTGQGRVLFKIRPHTLSPEHFYQSTDEGTVVVRYIVQPLTPSGTRLRIDAVFIESSGHKRHASDGQVENSEFEAISDTMKDIEDAEAKKRERLLHDQQQHQLEQLQAQLDQETSQLTEATGREHQLQQQLQQRQGLQAVRVKTAQADLKTEPYNQSKTVQLLSKGDQLTVLVQTPNWYRVQTASGEQGWVYRLMLETTP